MRLSGEKHLLCVRRRFEAAADVVQDGEQKFCGCHPFNVGRPMHWERARMVWRCQDDLKSSGRSQWKAGVVPLIFIWVQKEGFWITSYTSVVSHFSTCPRVTAFPVSCLLFACFTMTLALAFLQRMDPICFFCPLRASKEDKICILLGDYGDKLTMVTLPQSVTSLTQNHRIIWVEKGFIYLSQYIFVSLLQDGFHSPWWSIEVTGSGTAILDTLLWSHAPIFLLLWVNVELQPVLYPCPTNLDDFFKTQKLCYGAERQKEAVKPLLQIKSIHV